MPLLSQGKIIENHKIEGIGDDFIPKIVDRSLIDKVLLINDEDAINMARKIALELGIGVGISSGANLIASILAKEEIQGNVVTVFPDDNKNKAAFPENFLWGASTSAYQVEGANLSHGKVHPVRM